MTQRNWRELSRRERLYRFREMAKIALQAYGLADANLKLLQYGENVIYRVDLSSTSSSVKEFPYQPDRYCLRLHAWDEPAYIHSEMIWLEALVKYASLPVPAPVRTLEGDFVFKVTTDYMPHGRCVTLLRWLKGRKLNQGIRQKHLSTLGRLVAQLHTFSAAWQPPKEFSRPMWDWDAQLGGCLFDISLDELIDSIPKRFREPFTNVSQAAQRAMEKLGQDSDAFGLIHADLYPENILYRCGNAMPIDFEDCGYSYWIWDIAVALCTWAWGEHWVAMRDAFYEGYQAVRCLPEQQWALLDLFIATQNATMLLWASAFLQHDPKRTDEYVPWRDDSGERVLRFFHR